MTGIIQPERNRLEHLGVEYQWAIDSPSHYAEVFMAEKARAEASDILTRTIGQQIQLTRDGYQCRSANFGYRNQKVSTPDGKKKTIMMPDETEASFVVRMFELRADGGWTDDAICETINDMGYQSRTQNIYDPETRQIIGTTKPLQLSPKQLQRYVSRTIYCGVRCEKWNHQHPVRTPFEPLVSIELFNRANRGKVKITEAQDGSLSISENRNAQEQHRHNPEFLLRHVVKCNHCPKPLLASKSRGKSGRKFGYYHCSRGHKYFGVNSAEFEQTIANFLKTLQAKPGFLNLFREVVRDVWMEKNRGRRQVREAIQAHLKSVQARQSSLLDRIASCGSPIVQKKLEDQIEELEANIVNLTAKLNSNALKEDEIEAFFQTARTLMEHPEQSVSCAETKPQLEKIWSTIFQERPSYEMFLNRTPQLTLLYRLNRDFDGDKNLLAGQLSLQWNTFLKELRIVVEL
ncbi:MAG: recombinase family protein [Pseudomonadota bacterium]